MKRILIALVVIILIASMSLVGCKKAGVTSETPTVFTMANNIDCMWSWDPSDAFGEELPILFELYETLTRYHPLEDELEPVLATDWSVSPDGLTWTFTLREGVKFHCGHDFDSSDVKRSIERTMERGMGAAFIWLAVNSIETPDEKTVVFNLDYPVPIDLTVASAYGAFMYCMDCVEEKGEDYLSAGNELGTGPYKLQQWKRGDQVLLEKFGDYWRGWDGNHFEKVLLKVVPESGTARQMLEAGQVDYVRLLPFEDIEALKQNAAFTVTATPGFQNVYILINTQREPTNDPRVRQALAYSVPYDQIIENVMYGYATQSVGPIPKGMWGHDDTLPQYTYDLETARQLLTDAGYPDGGFSLMMTVASGDENHRKVAELWKAELTKLGIDLDIRTMPFDAQWDLAKSSNLDERQDLYILYYWPDVCSPQCYLEGCFITQTDPIIFNLCYYSDPQVDEWIIEAWETAGRDREAATAIYRQIQEKLIEDSPAIFLYDMQNVRVMNSSIRNFTDNPAYPYVLFIYDLYRDEG